jgi:hypothetical protein
MWRVCDQNVSANPYLHTCVDGVCVRVSQQLVCRLISWEKQRSDGSRSQVSMRPHRSKRGAAGKTDSRQPMFQIGRRWRERRGGDGGGGGDRWWSQRRSRRWIRGGRHFRLGGDGEREEIAAAKVIGAGARGTAIASGGGLAPTVKTVAAEVIRGGAKGTAAASGGGLAPAVEVVPMEQN